MPYAISKICTCRIVPKVIQTVIILASVKVAYMKTLRSRPDESFCDRNVNGFGFYRIFLGKRNKKILALSKLWDKNSLPNLSVTCVASNHALFAPHSTKIGDRIKPLIANNRFPDFFIHVGHSYSGSHGCGIVTSLPSRLARSNSPRASTATGAPAAINALRSCSSSRRIMLA